MKNHELCLSLFFSFLFFNLPLNGGEGFREVTLFKRRGLKGIPPSLTRIKCYDTRQSKEEIISVLPYTRLISSVKWLLKRGKKPNGNKFCSFHVLYLMLVHSIPSTCYCIMPRERVIK